MKTIVSESAIRTMIRESLENDRALADDAPPPIVPNPVADRTTVELDTDPIELRHVPTNKNELIIMVRNLLDDVPDDQSSELYRKIKTAFAEGETGRRDFAGARAKPSAPDINQAREMQRDPSKNESKKMQKSSIVNVVKKIVQEALNEADPSKKRMNMAGGFFDPEDPEMQDDPDDVEFLGDTGDDSGPFSDEEDETSSAWDPEPLDVDDEDEDESPKRRKSRAGQQIGAYGVDGESFEKIAAEMGFTQEGAFKAVNTAMQRFKALHEMDPEDREEMVLTGINDYIDHLASSEEVSTDEEELMRLHPRIVAMSDEFREFFSKYVKRATREMKADSQDKTDL